VVWPQNPGIHIRVGDKSIDRDIRIYQGLDLQGGMQVLLAADVPEEQPLDSADMDAAKSIVERRVNGLGVAEPAVQAVGSRRILVELPGIRDPQAAIDTLRQTGLMEWVDTGSRYLEPGTVVKTDVATADDGIAQVVIEHRFDRPNIGWIDVDNYGSSRDMADYLANLGCREFAVITADRVFPGHFERHRGFVEALAARGIEVPPEWDVERRRVLIDAGVSATLSLLGSRPTMPRVLYYTNVELAMGGLRALRSKRIAIPEQLVVAIFDDSHSSRWLPDSVLYLSQPAYEMGSTAARFLLTCQPGQVLQQMITPELFISPEILESLENKG